MSEGDYNIGSAKWNGLSKLIEEAGEVIQVAGKLIGNNGNIQHWDGSDLNRRLEEELADLVAAIAFFVETNPALAHQDIIDRSARKLDAFRGWNKP